MKRIVWADDKQPEFEEFQKNWEQADTDGWNIEFVNLDDLLSETDRTAIDLLLANPPEVLLLDWEGGSTQDLYSEAKSIVPTIILVSQYNESFLNMGGVFKKHPELKGRMLTKPISKQQLLGLIDRNAINERRKNKERDWDDFFALRYLDEKLNPIGISSAWQLGVDRPELFWDDDKITELRNGKEVYHSIFSMSAIDKNKFGPVQITTREVQPGMKVPNGVKYFQQIYDLPVDGVRIENIGRTVDGIISMMRDAGFKRGRYYHLADVPGIESYVLEMIARYPKDSGALPLPAANNLDDAEKETYEKYCCDFKKNKNDLIYLITPNTFHNHGTSSPYWKKCIDVTDVIEVLRVPVFLQETEEARRMVKANSEKIQTLRGEFIFDKGKNEKITPEDVARIKLPLRAALKYFDIARGEEHSDFEKKIDLLIHQFQKDLLECPDIFSIEDYLTTKVLSAIAEVQEDFMDPSFEVQRGVLYARYERRERKIYVVNEIITTGKVEDYLRGTSFDITDPICRRLPMVQCAFNFINDGIVTPNFHPQYNLTKEMRTQRKQAYRTAVRDNEERVNRLTGRLGSEIKTLVAFPVALGNSLLGVLVTRSNQPFEFTSRVVETIQKLIAASLPYLSRLHEKERTKNWNATIMHEMRNSLSMAKWRIDETIENNESKDVDIKHILERGIGMSSMFLKWLGMRNYNDDELERNTAPEFWWRINDLGDFSSRFSRNNQRWKCNLTEIETSEFADSGASAILFERVLCVLIDNAFKYGQRDHIVSCVCRVDAVRKFFIIKIVNFVDQMEIDDPNLDNLMSEEDIMPSKAAIGLTLAKMICKDVGARLDSKCIHKNQVCTFNSDLEWPFARLGDL